MKKLTFAALGISALLLVPALASASSDAEEMEEACEQAAKDEGVPLDEMASYIAECVASNMAAGEAEGGGEKEGDEGSVPASE